MNLLKRQVIRKIIQQVHRQIKPILDERIRNGFLRSSSRPLYDCMYQAFDDRRPGNNSDHAKAYHKLCDILIILYDMDTAYAQIFHRFIELAAELELDMEESYYTQRRQSASSHRI